jgi:hypothetical protein
MPEIRRILNACTDSECNLRAAIHAASEQISRAATLRTNMSRSQNFSYVTMCLVAEKIRQKKTKYQNVEHYIELD